MVAADVAKRVEALVDAGAVMMVRLSHGMVELPVGGALWQGDALVWCSLWPQDQHHAHMQEDGTPKVEHGRDVAWYATDGALVAYLCPWQESSSVDAATFPEEFARWQTAMSTPDAKKRLEAFLHDCFA